MGLAIAIITLVVLVLVVLVVSAPLRADRGRDPSGAGTAGAPADRDEVVRGVSRLEHDELEAAREAKYREIRDAELDYRTGKLSREDYQAIDTQLRAEAIEILNRLEPPEPE